MDPRPSEIDNGETSDSIPEASNKPGAKRRASRAGSRSVAALNAEQLARKRANDREAQRSIRQRTKDHIERLENRIRELTEGQNGNLEEVEQRNAELERELRNLKESLRINEGSIGSDYGGSMVHGPWNGPLPTRPTSAQPSSSGDWSRSFPSSLSSTPGPSINSSFANNYGPMLPCSGLPHETGTQFNQPLEQLGQNMSAFGRGQDPGWAARSVPSDPRMKQVSNMGPAPMIRPLVTHTPPLPKHRPAWELPLCLLPPSHPVDHLLIGIVQQQRSLLAAGAPKAEVVGPYHPSLRILAYPDQTEDGNALSTLIANILNRTPVPGFPERAACLLVMYHLAQWQIAPSPETYGNLPEWHKPGASQLITPHPIWVTQIPFGKLRDKVIANQDKYATDEFRELSAASMSINWPKQPIDLLVFDGDDVRASDEFVRHCRTLANWSLGEPFTRRYPELSDYCRFTTFQHAPQMNHDLQRY